MTPEKISRGRAIELARARHDEKWRPVPGYPSGDTMSTSYRMDRYESGWVSRQPSPISIGTRSSASTTPTTLSRTLARSGLALTQTDAQFDLGCRQRWSALAAV